MSHLRKGYALLWNTLTAALCAGGLACIFLQAVLSRAMALSAFVYSVLFALTFSAADVLLKGRRRALLIVLLLLAEGALFAFGKGQLHLMVQSAKALYLHFAGVQGAVLPYAKGICMLFSLVFTFIVYFLVREDAFGFAAACTLVLLCLGLYLTRGEGLIFALPVMVSLLLVLGSVHGRRAAALPVALVLAVTGYLLMPREGTVSKPLADIAQQVRDATDDYFFFTETREAFSMYKAGFQPLKERLGGPASPSEDTVMEVHGPENTQLYLRAAAYNEYTGLNWYDTISSRRYLFASRSYDALKKNIFDMERPLAEAEWPQEQLTVRLLRDGATTLFVPQRIRALQVQSERMVPYFNTAGEIYITRNLLPDDAYQVDFLHLDVQSAAVKAWIADCAQLMDERMAEVESQYLTVPEHIQQEVHDLAASITAGLTDPLEKALAIRDYLSENYGYRLDVEEPPSSVDFVAYFLLAGQEGYCTYFASAQTMLSRMAGVPARYVVGYLARTDGRGNAIVSGQDAHAWTEIYLNGFGWLPIDATPGNQQGNEAQDDQEEEENSDFESPPTPSPSPSPSPTPSPAPESPEASTPPTPTPENRQDEPPPTPEAPPEEPEDDKPPFPWLWLLLALLVLLALILWVHLTAPSVRAKRRPDRAGQIYLNACVTLLACMGMKRQSGETLLEFAARVKTVAPMDAFWDMASARVYGKDRRVDAVLARESYDLLWQKAGRLQQLKSRLYMLFGK